MDSMGNPAHRYDVVEPEKEEEEEELMFSADIGDVLFSLLPPRRCSND